MPMDILSDTERELSVIWDSDTGRAYGYITQGAGHREALQAFVDGLETHVAAYEPHELSHLWEAFMQTIAGVQAGQAGTEAETPPEPSQEPALGVPEPEPAPDTTPAPESPPEPAQEPPGGEPVPDPTTQSSPTREQSTGTDGGSQRLVEQSCWNCNGSGIERVTGQKCNVCDGSGVVYTPTTQATA